MVGSFQPQNWFSGDRAVFPNPVFFGRVSFTGVILLRLRSAGNRLTRFILSAWFHAKHPGRSHTGTRNAAWMELLGNRLPDKARFRPEPLALGSRRQWGSVCFSCHSWPLSLAEGDIQTVASSLGIAAFCFLVHKALLPSLPRFLCRKQQGSGGVGVPALDLPWTTSL
jgi:hypothetical protein